MPKVSIKSAKRKFKRDAQLHLPQHFPESLPGGNFAIVIDFRLPEGDPRIAPDVDNLLKGAFDVIKGSLIRDDRQIKEVHARVIDNAINPGFYVTLHPLTV